MRRVEREDPRLELDQRRAVHRAGEPLGEGHRPAAGPPGHLARRHVPLGAVARGASIRPPHPTLDELDLDQPVGQRDRGLDRVGQPLAQLVPSSPAGRRRPRCRACTSCRARSPPPAVRSSPSILTRAKPSARSSSSSLPYSPLRPRTTGASTMNRVPSGSSITWSMICSADCPLIGRPQIVAVRLADPRPQQPQVVVDLGHRADGRARVARGRLLVDRDRRRQPLDRVDVGLVHLPEELARVGRQRLDVPALALGVDRVERERRLARARQPGDHRQRVPREATVTSLRLCSRAPETTI